MVSLFSIHSASICVFMMKFPSLFAVSTRVPMSLFLEQMRVITSLDVWLNTYFFSLFFLIAMLVYHGLAEPQANICKVEQGFQSLSAHRRHSIELSHMKIHYILPSTLLPFSCCSSQLCLCHCLGSFVMLHEIAVRLFSGADLCLNFSKDPWTPVQDEIKPFVA